VAVAPKPLSPRRLHGHIEIDQGLLAPRSARIVVLEVVHAGGASRQIVFGFVCINGPIALGGAFGSTISDA
jgi:hypothetical protein